jgi:hypothetical protein
VHSRPDFIRKKFGPLRDKTLHNALAHKIAQEFPRIGGPRICGLCAEMLLDVVCAHMRPQDHVTHGQALWMAVSVNDPPRHRQRIADTDLVPVMLDLSTAEDVHNRRNGADSQAHHLLEAIRRGQGAAHRGARDLPQPGGG